VEGLARATIALWSARVLIFQLEHLGEPVTGQNLLTCIPIAVGLTYAVVVTFGQGDGGPVERSR
jgi:hypothetical protein